MSFPRYPKYKPSGVEWLGPVPEHWRVLPIKRLVAVPITDGPHETPQFVDEGIPFVSAEAVSSGRIDFSKVRACISEEDNARYSLKYAPRLHDIYMVKSGATTGITAIVEDRTDFNIWSPLAVIRCDGDAVPHFVLNFMRSRNFLEAITLNWSFGTQQNIGMGVIENLACTLPPLDEQTRIAAFLDRETAKIDELVAEQRRLMELLKEKRQAVISQAVTKGLNPHTPMKPSGIEWLGDVPEHWEIRRLKFLCDIQTGDKDTENAVEDGRYPFFVRSQTVERINSMTFDCEAVLTAGDGVGVGKVFHYHNGPFDFHQRVYMMNNFREVTGPFLFHFLRENFHKVALEGGAKSTVDSLRRPVFTNFSVCVPPKAEQEAIVTEVEHEAAKFDALSTEAQRAIDLLQERRTAIISAAVTGQIDVRPVSESKSQRGTVALA